MREFQANAMVPVHFAADPAMLDQLPTAVALTIFLTTQEALANVARHARATQVNVHIGRQRGEVVLDVADNGVGFSLDEETLSVGHGLANMRARAEERQGGFTVESSPGEGTRIRLRLPV
jgi:signal transduction histidine kinase